LVVIAIIGMLVALLIPAVNMARETARFNTCSNNARQLALGFIQFDTSNRRLPGYVNRTGMGSKPEKYGNWTVMLLPYLEQRQAFESYSDNTPAADVRMPHIESLNCPSNPPEGSNPTLVYRANAGKKDPDDLSLYNGVLTNSVPTNNVRLNDKTENVPKYGTRSSLSYVSSADGASRTLLLSEDLRFAENWWKPMPLAQTPDWEIDSCILWSSEAEPNADQILGVNEDREFTGYESATSKLKWARPSSNHPGKVVAAFCDGSMRSVGDNMDPLIYKRIMTTKDSKSFLKNGGSPTEQNVIKVPLGDDQL
jgi:type II secretory pathway pseudopilin PulG